ncbi:MAG: hypothetical protein MR739_00665 [Spirochaetia bacterium]|nr:hypothetical protein [Spirochaetia bacterium]
MKKQKKMMKLKKRNRIDCIKIPGFEGMPIATDTMLCPNCKSIIGCFAGPPPVCPHCGKRTYGLSFGGGILKKLLKKK